MNGRLQHDQVVGTRKGYMWHRRRDEQACDACRAGNTREAQETRDDSRPEHPVLVPLRLLGQILAAVPGEERARFEDRLGELASRAARIR